MRRVSFGLQCQGNGITWTTWCSFREGVKPETRQNRGKWGTCLVSHLNFSWSWVGALWGILQCCVRFMWGLHKNFTHLAANVQRRKWMSTSIILLWEDFGSYEVTLCKYTFNFIAYKMENKYILYGKVALVVCACVSPALSLSSDISAQVMVPRRP